MDHKELRKLHPELFRLWVRYKFKFGDNPIPKENKNYIISIVSDSIKCFVVLEYNDGWHAETSEGKTHNINIPSKEIISFSQKDISENNFFDFVLEIIQIYSVENRIIVCNRTNGSGRVIFDALRKEIYNMLELENVRIFPVARRSKYGKELFAKIGHGWEMSITDEKNCLDAMRTAQERGYFILAADKSKHAFGITSAEEQINIEPFVYCWMMLSFIRLSTMPLFGD